MSSLNFNDGVSIDTSGDLRTLRLKDGWYVVGNGMSVPCSDKDDAAETLKSLAPKPSLADRFDAMEAQQAEAEERLNDARYEAEDIKEVK